MLWSGNYYYVFVFGGQFSNQWSGLAYNYRTSDQVNTCEEVVVTVKRSEQGSKGLSKKMQSTYRNKQRETFTVKQRAFFGGARVAFYNLFEMVGSILI